jgi:hypothetical protein
MPIPLEVLGDVKGPEMLFGVPLIRLLSQRPAAARGAGDANRIHPAAHEQILDAPRFASHDRQLGLDTNS